MEPENRTEMIEYAAPTAENARKAIDLSGLDFLRQIVSGEIPQPPINAAMSFRLTEADEGRAVFTGDPVERLYNPLGMVHGAFVMALIDAATGCALHSTLPAGVGYTTVETKVNMLRPVLIDSPQLRCEGRLVSAGSRIGVAEADVRDADGKVYAFGTSTLLIIRS